MPKPRFVNTLLGEPVAKVGQEVESETQYVVPYRLERPAAEKRRVFIVDTPGFNDTFEPLEEILRRVAVWLANSYGTHQKVAGIIFLQDITAARMHGSSKKVMRVFEKLCGKNAASKVLFMTTKWDTISMEIGTRHEVEIINYWKGMLSAKPSGSRITRYDGQRSSAKAIISEFLKHDNGALIQIQKQMVDDRVFTPETHAGVAASAGTSSKWRIFFCF
ncbi:hypothetical protein DXG01_006490 [Tephrocybe rancida]|nr:hypothetical protein DXG01_006490 [Tephrocybe rancida]